MSQEKEPQFTQGPWHQIGSGIFAGPSAKGQQMILTVHAGGMPQEANARLVLEATAMFALLQKIVSQGNSACTCTDCTAGRALINRVLGESES